WRPPPAHFGQPGVSRGQPGPPGPQERRELGAVRRGHVSILPHVRPGRVVPRVPGSAGLSRLRNGRRSVQGMTAKIALLTGANKGIGCETARQLGARDMTVLVGARDTARGQEAERVLRDAGAAAHVVQLDVTDAKSIQQAAEWIEAEYGRLDVLVN